ncbi:MAG: DUF624 domain-containing protein, partial [Ardenticatenaceae bacterium]
PGAPRRAIMSLPMSSHSDAEPLEPLRIEGGSVGTVRAALSGWWREIFILTGLNLLWTITLFTVIALPPATAAIFFVARRVLEGDPFVGWETFAQPIRRYWAAAWRWGIVFFLVAGVAATNLWLYQDALGTIWDFLRWVWATILVVWVSLNLFFWPLWFAEEPAQRTLRATWRNCVAFLAANPLPALFVTIIVLLLGTLSFLTGIPLGILFMVWTALLATATLAAYLPRL